MTDLTNAFYCYSNDFNALSNKNPLIDSQPLCQYDLPLHLWHGTFSFGRVFKKSTDVKCDSLNGIPRNMAEFHFSPSNFLLSNDDILLLKNASDKFKFNQVEYIGTDLQHCPSVSTMIIELMKIKSLDGITQKLNWLEINQCSDLCDAKGLPQQIHTLSVNHCPNLSFHAIKDLSIIGDLTWNNNKDRNFNDFHLSFPSIKGWIIIDCRKFHSHFLSLLLVENLQGIRLIPGHYTYDEDELIFQKQAISIFNKYLPNTTGKKGMLRCQAELIDAGYAAYAQL